MSVLDIIFIFTLGIPFAIFGTYFVSMFLPLFLGRKLETHQHENDMYSTQSPSKLIIFYTIGFLLWWWWAIKPMFIDPFGNTFIFPFLFYFLMYCFSYYLAEVFKGRKSYMQKLLDGERPDLKSGPNLYYQLQSQCLVIMALVVYQIFWKSL